MDWQQQRRVRWSGFDVYQQGQGTEESQNPNGATEHFKRKWREDNKPINNALSKWSCPEMLPLLFVNCDSWHLFSQRPTHTTQRLMLSYLEIHDVSPRYS